MTATELNEQFALEGVLSFDQHGELTRAQITLPTCSATMYLQGAHLTHWQPVGHRPVLFLSERSHYLPGKAIRGGIPICFPWFGARSGALPGPAHGFARIEPWELAFAALMPDSGEGAQVQLIFVLGESKLSESLGYKGFRVAYEVLLGRALTLKLTVANFSEDPLRFEEALHSYFHVHDVRNASISGLESATYLDKRDDGRSRTAASGPMRLTEFSDRVFPANTASTLIDDPGNRRTIRVMKQNSATTVVWNPWPEGSAPLSDLAAGEWQNFLCVEAANTATDAVTLKPGEAHTMSVIVSVEAAE